MKNQKRPKSLERESRRRFAKGAAAALAAAPLAAAARAQTPTPTPAEPKAPPGPPPAAAPPQGQSSQPASPVAEAYAEVARVRYGERLNDEEMARVKRDIRNNVRAAGDLAAVKLNNWDEPDFTFEA